MKKAYFTWLSCQLGNSLVDWITYHLLRARSKSGNLIPSEIIDSWLLSAPCECQGIGDPHYRTFDGEMIHFMDRCTYTLSQAVNRRSASARQNCSFRIEALNEDRRAHAVSAVNVSRTKRVYFKFRGRTIELHKNARIVVSYSNRGQSMKQKWFFLRFVLQRFHQRE